MTSKIKCGSCGKLVDAIEGKFVECNCGHFNAVSKSLIMKNGSFVMEKSDDK